VTKHGDEKGKAGVVVLRDSTRTIASTPASRLRQCWFARFSGSSQYFLGARENARKVVSLPSINRKRRESSDIKSGNFPSLHQIFTIAIRFSADSFVVAASQKILGIHWRVAPPAPPVVIGS
jgi:hypothetical protein